jgi:hypothetical protein
MIVWTPGPFSVFRVHCLSFFEGYFFAPSFFVIETELKREPNQQQEKKNEERRRRRVTCWHKK